MNLRVSRCAGVVIVVGLICCGTKLAVPAQGQATAGADSELERFNEAMRRIYADSRAQLLAETRPVIVAGTNDVTLITSSGRQTKRYTPALYHQLKTVSHVVLGMVGAMTPWPEPGENESRWRKALRTIDTRAQALLAQIDRLGLEPATKDRQRRILLVTRRFIEVSEKSLVADRDSFRSYLEAIKPDWLANVMAATRAQLEALNAIVQGWRSQMSQEEWGRLMVVLLGSRMPRVDNLQTAYFARLLGDDARGTRLIYAENIFDTEAALRLIGVIVIDRHLSSLVFGDPMRMDRDLLGYAAGMVLDELLPRR